MGGGFLRKANAGYQQAPESSRSALWRAEIGASCTPAAEHFRRKSAPFRGCETHPRAGSNCTLLGVICTLNIACIFNKLRSNGFAACRIPCACQYPTSATPNFLPAVPRKSPVFLPFRRHARRAAIERNKPKRARASRYVPFWGANSHHGPEAHCQERAAVDDSVRNQNSVATVGTAPTHRVNALPLRRWASGQYPHVMMLIMGNIGRLETACFRTRKKRSGRSRSEPMSQ